MGVFEHFPYTNFHDLNLDWILRIIKELDTEVNSFIEQNVLTYADPIDWNVTTQYAKNTVVVDPVSGTAYMSITAVPQGILLTNTSYWQPIFNYQQTVITMKEQIAAIDFGDGNAPEDIPIYTLFWYKNILYRATRAITAGGSVVVGTNAEHVTVEDAIKAIKSAGDIRRESLTNISDTAQGTITRNATGDIEDTTGSDAKRTAENIIDTAAGDIRRESLTNISDTARGTITRNATGDIEDTTGSDAKRTAENIIDTATGDYTETAGDKTENYTNRTVTATGDVLESVTGKKTVNATDIILNPTNPLTYKTPEELNSSFKYIPLKDAVGNEYKVLVDNNTGTLGSDLEYVTPQMFGDGTGGTDWGPEIQSAINSGKNIVFPAGDYTIVTPFELTTKKSSSFIFDASLANLIYTGDNYMFTIQKIAGGLFKFGWIRAQNGSGILIKSDTGTGGDYVQYIEITGQRINAKDNCFSFEVNNGWTNEIVVSNFWCNSGTNAINCTVTGTGEINRIICNKLGFEGVTNEINTNSGTAKITGICLNDCRFLESLTKLFVCTGKNSDFLIIGTLNQAQYYNQFFANILTITSDCTQWNFISGYQHATVYNGIVFTGATPLYLTGGHSLSSNETLANYTYPCIVYAESNTTAVTITDNPAVEAFTCITFSAFGYYNANASYTYLKQIVIPATPTRMYIRTLNKEGGSFTAGPWYKWVITKES